MIYVRAWHVRLKFAARVQKQTRLLLNSAKYTIPPTSSQRLIIDWSIDFIESTEENPHGPETVDQVFNVESSRPQIASGALDSSLSFALENEAIYEIVFTCPTL